MAKLPKRIKNGLIIVVVATAWLMVYLAIISKAGVLFLMILKIA